MKLPRLSVVGLMLLVAAACIALASIRLAWLASYLNEQTVLHALMADLCSSESDFMIQRAADCRSWAGRGVAWDTRAEEAENLKVCPYPWDGPRTESWADQAAVWERAATRGREAASRHEAAISGDPAAITAAGFSLAGFLVLLVLKFR